MLAVCRGKIQKKYQKYLRPCPLLAQCGTHLEAIRNVSHDPRSAGNFVHNDCND